MSSLPVSTPEPRTTVRRRPLRPAPTGQPIIDAPAPVGGQPTTRRRTPLRAAPAPEAVPEVAPEVAPEPKPVRPRRQEPLRALDPVPERPALSLVGPPDEEYGDVEVPGLAGFLAALAPDTLHVLHHRHIAANDTVLDHLVVTEHGVWVIATVHVDGVVELSVERKALTGDELLIRGESGASHAQALDLQIASVLDALDHVGVVDEVPVRGAICFVDTELAEGQRPVRVSGHEVTWPTALAPLLVARGPFDAEDRDAVRRFLDRTFPPAS
jgi:hypothetical protein